MFIFLAQVRRMNGLFQTSLFQSLNVQELADKNFTELWSHQIHQKIHVFLKRSMCKRDPLCFVYSVLGYRALHGKQTKILGKTKEFRFMEFCAAKKQLLQQGQSCQISSQTDLPNSFESHMLNASNSCCSRLALVTNNPLTSARFMGIYFLHCWSSQVCYRPSR